MFDLSVESNVKRVPTFSFDSYELERIVVKSSRQISTPPKCNRFPMKFFTVLVRRLNLPHSLCYQYILLLLLRHFPHGPFLILRGNSNMGDTISNIDPCAKASEFLSINHIMKKFNSTLGKCTLSEMSWKVFKLHPFWLAAIFVLLH